MPVDFEAGDAWWERLASAGFDRGRPAVVASTGVSMYLTREAIAATLRELATLAPGSTLAMTFLLPLELVDDAGPPGLEHAEQRRAGPRDAVHQLLRAARVPRPGPRRPGSPTSGTCPGANLNDRYFAGRPDGLRMSTGEDFLIATT